MSKKPRQMNKSYRLETSERATPKTPHAPHPHGNLGSHLKRPTDGEYVTETRWVDRKR